MTRTAKEIHQQFGILDKAPDFTKLMEIMFDMSATVHAIIAADKSKAMSDFMDAIEGSRGLFSMLYAWVEEFHVAFETSNSQEDYIPRVDDFAREKFFDEFNGHLVKRFEDITVDSMTAANHITVGIQLLPVVDDGDGAVSPQFSGPDDNTTGWSVYRRLDDGTVVWELDADNRGEATTIAFAFAKRYVVPIEPFPWVKESTDVQA